MTLQPHGTRCPSLRRMLAGKTGKTLLLAASAGLIGCTTDSYLDPSIVGRWETVPTTVPILDRLAIIEQAGVDEVEYSDVTPDDLIPEVEQYRIGPGDQVEIIVWDLFVRGQPERFNREVDRRGFIDLPQIGEIYADGLTREQTRQAIVRAVADAQIREDATVSVVIVAPRRQTFTLMGSVQQGGTYGVGRTDFRLLEALAVGGAINEDADAVYVIRHVPLTDEAAGRVRPPEQPGGNQIPPRNPGQPTQPPPSGEDLLDLIDDVTTPPTPPSSGPASDGGSPGAFEPGGAVVQRRGNTPAPTPQPASEPEAPPPAVPLVEDRPGAPVNQPPVAPPGGSGDGAQWMYLNGRWVLVKRKPIPPEAASQPDVGPTLVTQRVIKVPLKPLLAGDARYNIVVRPGDMIRVPRREDGTFFITGQISRGGSFQLTDKMTLKRAIATAGGLGSLAIPERVDLTRMVGEDREAIVRVNLRAIEEGTQPDFYLKDNDVINIGTTSWALPLAVVRGGFRSSYGFGFLLDRNFGNDVFGAPPTNRQN